MDNNKDDKFFMLVREKLKEIQERFHKLREENKELKLHIESLRGYMQGALSISSDILQDIENTINPVIAEPEHEG